MAATIIIYAGAIVVTFLFVIMLAQQEGPSNADQRSREPFLASLAGCVLLASLLCILQGLVRNAWAWMVSCLSCSSSAMRRMNPTSISVLGDPEKAVPGKSTPDLVHSLREAVPEGVPGGR